MQLPTIDNVKTIRVLTYFNGAFIGIPYEMRPGQQPRDILGRDNWVWLGSPGWYGSMSADQRAIAVDFMNKYKNEMTWYEGAWIDLEDL